MNSLMRNGNGRKTAQTMYRAPQQSSARENKRKLISSSGLQVQTKISTTTKNIILKLPDMN